MTELDDLASGKSIIYILTRLFDIAEKIKAERVERAVLEGLSRAFQERGITPTSDTRLTFVPFRDTDQDEISAPNKTKVIYEEDMRRLSGLFALVGFLDGLSKDEGVCMEIGFAYGSGVPILVILTDFIRREFKEMPGTEHLLDPVLIAMSTEIIYEHTIPDMQAPFLDRLELALEGVYRKIADEFYLLAITPSKVSRPSLEKEPEIDAYVDFGGGHYEWERLMQSRLVEDLNARGVTATASQRYAWHPEQPTKKTALMDVKKLGVMDISNAARAKVVVTCGDGDEMSSGSAAIHGLARQMDKTVTLYDSRATNLVGDSGHKMSRNLMIDYSADKVITRFEELPGAIEDLLGD